MIILLKRVTLKKILKRVCRLVYQEQISTFYSLDKIDFCIVDNNDIDINVQHYEDMLKFSDPNVFYLNRHLVSDALKKISDGHILYSIIKDDVLAHYGWMRPIGKSQILGKDNISIDPPQGSMMLCGFYSDVRYRGQGLYQITLNKMLSDCFFKFGLKEVHIASDDDNPVSKHVIEKIGFSPYLTTRYRRFLWIEKRSSSAI